MSLSLYQIKDTYLYFLQKVEAGEVPEDAINDTLESIEGEFQDKADNIACYVKGLIAEAKAIKGEVETLDERMKSKINKADKLTDYLQMCMTALNVKKLETTRNVLQIKTNPPAVDVTDQFLAWAKENRNDLLSYKEPTPDKAAIKEVLKTEQLPHCQMIQKERLVIK